MQQALLLLATGRGDLLAQRLLSRTHLLELGQGGAPPRIGVEDLVNGRGIVATRNLAGLDPVGVVGEEFDVDHRVSLSRGRIVLPRLFTPHAVLDGFSQSAGMTASTAIS